jgi:DNA polymerase epsilon subunit 2
MSDIRHFVLRIAKQQQCMIHPSAIKPLIDFLCMLGDDKKDQLMHVLEYVKECTPDRTITEEVATAAIAQVSAKAIRSVDNNIQVIPMQEWPVVVVDEVSLAVAISQDRKIASAADIEVHALRQRYFSALARARRSGQFSRPGTVETVADAATEGTGRLPLIPLSSLDGIRPDSEVCIMGMLRRQQVTNGDEPTKWNVEDPRHSVALNLEALRAIGSTACGLFAEGCIIVAQGTWSGTEFIALALGFPPSERREQSITALPHYDYFGLAPSDTLSAAAREATAQSSLMVVLSNVTLDKPHTLPWLSKLLREFSGRASDEMYLPHVTFVMTGNFSSMSYGAMSHLEEGNAERQKYFALWESLASTIVTAAPDVAQHSQFVFVPGPSDPVVGGGVLPQLPLSASLTAALKKKLHHFVFAPNPCRLRFFTQEILICRQNFFNSMSAHLAVPANPEMEPYDHLVKTIVDQGHLWPHVSATPIAKSWDHAMHLFPVPHLLLLCDETEQWESEYQGFRIVNPGSFSHKSTFLWYTPADKDHSINQLPSS